jgi:hypothetical protein
LRGICVVTIRKPARLVEVKVGNRIYGYRAAGKRKK